jgi:hypothetical protein
MRQVLRFLRIQQKILEPRAKKAQDPRPEAQNPEPEAQDLSDLEFVGRRQSFKLVF